MVDGALGTNRVSGADPVPTRAGYIALMGRPNVGKSTLLNALLGCKLSITSPKPQTTRHTLLGIKTTAKAQLVFVDTPGLHRHAPHAVNRHMNRAADRTLDYCDVAVMVVEALRWTPEDDDVAKRLAAFQGPRFAAVNKIDRLKDKGVLLPFLDRLQGLNLFDDLVPVAALKRDNLERLEALLGAALPEAPFLFAEDDLTTASQRFLAGELVREKLMRQLDRELPYATTVQVETFHEAEDCLAIDVVIWVDRPGQKGIVIGAKGERLKAIATAARLDMERLFERRVFLQTWVKVRAGWADDEGILRQLGHGDG
ncbi:MAG: GTPase Era [Candidatus Competibacterales bacterium]